jgi:hypothetical protein
MGMDFVALMKYGGPDERLSRVLDRLEAGSPEHVRGLARLMHERGFGLGREEPAVWEFRYRPELRDRRLVHRPMLPNLGVSLWLPEGFLLTFGKDAIEVYHLLRWHFFLTEHDLQRAMLDACTCFGHLFGATDCVVTSDFSPVVQAFREGQGFDASLASAGPEHGERLTLADLSLEIPLGEVMRFVEPPGRPSQTRHQDWDLDRSPPEGWRRVTTWDSRGYWRLGLGPWMPDPFTDRSEGGRPQAGPRTSRAETGPPDEGWWATCGEPDAMLDRLLKQDDVSWRQVWLWACACVRRVWSRLTVEPARRAVEVAERFADGQADRRAVENAANAVERVRKGDRGGNRAAARLARVCSPAHLFPPADVSDAVVDVVGGEDSPEASVAERKVQAGLLRDIFGPHPLHAVTGEVSRITPTVVALAQAAYDERELPSGQLDPARLAVLADALEDAGATDADLLAHLRSPGPHVRGCYAVDLLLGRK